MTATAPDSRAVVKREGTTVQIVGLEKVYWGGTTDRQNSINAALAAALTAAGRDDASYDHLMGVSGAAFRLQVMQPGWCPSAACSPCGFDCMGTAFSAAGVKVKWHDIGMAGPTSKPDTVRDAARESARKAVVASIDAGLPVLMESEECSLAVGYRDGGKTLLVRPYSAKKDGYVEMKKWPWGFGVITLGDPPARRKVVVESLKLALHLAALEMAGKYACGSNAWKLWIEQLLEDKRFDASDKEGAFNAALGNGYVYCCLIDARLAAAKYLRSIAGEFNDGAKAHLLKAADFYDECQLKLCKQRDLAPFPWDIKPDKPWTADMRKQQSALLKEVFPQEQAALAEIKAALEAEGILTGWRNKSSGVPRQSPPAGSGVQHPIVGLSP